MKLSIAFILVFFSGFNTLLLAQEENEEEKSSTFFGGINLGSYFANSNTAVIYTGGSDITPYGIHYILTLPQNQATFNNYFKHPYYIQNLPLTPSYKAALDVGFHAGAHFSKLNTIFLDIDIAKLKFEQAFTIAIEDPSNQSPEPTYEQIPILGEEKRFNFNFGTQIGFYDTEKTAMYWSVFGNFNAVRMERNYFVINNTNYELYQNVMDPLSVKPGGVGYGGGTGLGFKYKLTTSIILDFTYNLYYTKTNMTEDIHPFGIHHGIVMRVLWY